MDKTIPNELVIESDIETPGPLDPLIACLTLRTNTNRVTEGYDLSLTAFFGSERITLIGEDFSVNVEISISRAKIELDFIRCRQSSIGIKNDETTDEWVVEQKRSVAHNKKRGVQMLLEAVVSNNCKGSATAGVDFEATKANSSEQEAKRTIKNWQKINKNTVLVGRGEGELDGNEIDDFEGWRVIPNETSVPSGVKATLTVRENWINIIQIQSDTYTGRIGQKAKNLLKTNDERRQKLFGYLLRHLATKGLSNQNHSKEAILAVEYFLVRPEIENATSNNSSPATGSVVLDSTAIETFLNSSPGTEVETLISIGISHQDIRENMSQPKPRNGLFIGMSSPLKALEAYKVICNRKTMPRAELDDMVEGRVSQDLINLDLIKTKNGVLYLTSDNGEDPEDMLRYVAARAETVITTRAILMNDSAASNKEIADMLITKFGKKYSTDGSKRRVGNTLKRWARWLEPHLIDPSSIEGAKQKVSALDKNYSIGPPTMATPENLAIAQTAIDAGESNKTVAKTIGVSSQTIWRWKQSGKLKEPAV